MIGRRIMRGRRLTNGLRGGSFNLLYGRSIAKVRAELLTMLSVHQLDFLCVQEAEGYARLLRTLPGFVYYTGTGRGGNECGILVREGIAVGNPRYGFFGDGWTTIRGGRHAAANFVRLTLDGWLRIGTCHAPLPITFDRGRAIGPRDRVDDYMALFRKLWRFFWRPSRHARVVASDWNQHASTAALWAPRGLAAQVGATVFAPRNGQPRTIDYAIAKGCQLVDVHADTETPENSDHELIVFTVLAT